MARDLGLDALAAIQALEARPKVERYRNDWMDGRPLGSPESAVAWLRGQLGAKSTDDGFRPFIDGAEGPKWWASASVYNGARTGGYTTPWGTAAGDLAALSLGLEHDYDWPADEAALFVLADVIPCLESVRIIVTRRLSSKGSVAGPLSETITLRCRARATPTEVAGAYEQGLRSLAEMHALKPRERIKSVGSERVRDLAILGGRIALAHFASWNEALIAYKSEHLKDVTYRDSADMGRFRRDVRLSYKRVTGLDLDFQPTRKDARPRVRIDVQDNPWENGSVGL